jgi:CubicO group peptidase (beta-lactamase class C family)
VHRRSLFAGCVLGCLLAAPSMATAAEPPASLELARRIGEYVRPFEEAGQLSGTLLVARDGTAVYERSFGMADYELAVPNTPSTRFCVASISKEMTRMVAIRLMEQRKLAMGDTLAKWIPDFPRGGEITVEHLLRHRSGIPHRVTTAAEETLPKTAADMAELAKRQALLFAPGSQHSYSSGGYAVLARVLELASGRYFEQLLDEYVFAPAGAIHSVHPSPHRLIHGRARSYVGGIREPFSSPLQDYSYLVGAGSVFSTPRDLLALQRTVLAGGYGESVKLSLVEENGNLEWNGLTAGYQSFADYHAGQKLSVIFTGNLFTGAADQLRESLSKIAAGEAVAPPRVPKVEPVAIPVALRKRYEGIYEFRPGVREELRFTDVDGIQAWVGNRLLIATSENTFHCPQDYGTIKMVTGKDGMVEALEWSLPAGSYKFPRVGPLKDKP